MAISEQGIQCKIPFTSLREMLSSINPDCFAAGLEKFNKNIVRSFFEQYHVTQPLS